MGVEENKEVIRRFAEDILSGHDISKVNELISENYIYRGPTGQEMKGPDGFMQLVQIALTGFPDGNYTIENMVAEGDAVAVHYTRTGTHTGEYRGINPTGKQINVPVAFFYRIADGKIIEALGFSDSLLLMQQLGVNPTD